jgi:hypothetical protein
MVEINTQIAPVERLIGGKVLLSGIDNLAGFSTNNASPGEVAKIITKGFYTSDEKEFYQYIKHITNIFINKAELLVSQVVSFLVLIHNNGKADLYYNDFRVLQWVRVKRGVKKGEKISINDLADLGKISFPDIEILETDSIIYCFKSGWKFGLYFNFLPANGENKLNIDEVMKELGRKHSYLLFEDVYLTFENEVIFKELINDGWFPFLTLLGSNYEDLIAAYKDKFDFRNKIIKIMGSYDKSMIDQITLKWWGNSVFSSKKKILQAGIDAYNQNDESGYINAIKTPMKA